MNLVPIVCTWTGEAWEPLQHFRTRCAEALEVGGRYRLEVRQERSQASHSHYFAAVNEAWVNLPDNQAERFPSSEHLRKYALIRAGYRDERSISCSTKAEAQRVAAFVKPVDDHAIVLVREQLVVIYTAKSQSAGAMNKREFEESKAAVLQILAGMIGVQVAELKERGRAA
jgi:hypothetical protein